MTAPAVSFTQLTENSTNTTMKLPDGFDPMTAWLLAQCCTLTYLQYDTSKPPDFSRLTLTGAKLTPGTAHVLWASEANVPESSPDYPGSYAKLPVGFAADIRQTGVDSKSSLPAHFVVVALRGTQTWDEWIDDAEAYSAFYGDRPGLVHGGICGLYTWLGKGEVLQK